MYQGPNIQEARERTLAAREKDTFLIAIKSNLPDYTEELRKMSTDQKEGKGPTPLKLGLTFNS